MDIDKIGAFIAERRKAKCLTQKDIAEKLCVTDRAVSKWECGKGLPDVSLMMPLCELLEITVNELLNGERIAEQEVTERAEKQIVTQLAEKQVLAKRVWLMTAVAALAILIIVPMMIIGNFSSESVVRKLFNSLCIIVPVFCIIIAKGVKRAYGKKPTNYLGEAVLIIGITMILAAGILMFFDSVSKDISSILLIIGLIIEATGIGIKRKTRR